MTVRDDTRAYLVELEEYWAAAERGENDGTVANQPKPPNPEVAFEVAAICAKSIGQLLDYRKTGKFQGMEPSPESQLEAAELIERAARERGL